MSHEHCPILLEDPELAEHLDSGRLAPARRDCIARVVHLRAGPWSSPGVQSARYGFGMLVLDGLLIRRVGLDQRFGAELLGAGDVLRPWQREGIADTLPHSGGWQVLQPTRMAVLDEAFAHQVARYPEVTAALFGRAVRRSRYLAVSMAIVHQPRVDLRLHMLFWALADRWGKVHADGVHLPMRLTHQLLSELIAARRPSVTKALKELAERGAVRWQGDAWILDGPPPVELAHVQAMSTM